MALIPAKAGTQGAGRRPYIRLIEERNPQWLDRHEAVNQWPVSWVPAFAGMSAFCKFQQKI